MKKFNGNKVSKLMAFFKEIESQEEIDRLIDIVYSESSKVIGDELYYTGEEEIEYDIFD